MGETESGRFDWRVFEGAMKSACAVACRVPWFANRARAIFAEAVGRPPEIAKPTADAIFTAWALFTDDVCDGGGLSLAIAFAPEQFDADEMAMAIQVRDSVTWGHFAIEGVDPEASTMALVEDGTGRRIEAAVEDRVLLARRLHDHEGVLSGYVAHAAGSWFLTGQVFYDRAPYDESSVRDMGALALSALGVGGRAGARVF